MKRQNFLNDHIFLSDTVVYKKISRTKQFSSALIIILFTFGWLLWMGHGTKAGASWLIDPGKFHVSAHGQTSCLDCHEDIQGRSLHPDPGEVNKKSADLFDADQCLACHDGIMEDIKQGSHGGRKIEDPKRYTSCIFCHNPHEQRSLGEDRVGGLDPSRPPLEQCGVCHEERPALPVFSSEDEACMVCHGSPDPETATGRERISDFCLHCHGKGGTEPQSLTAEKIPLIDLDEYDTLPHADTACTVCHVAAAGFEHGAQKTGDCSRCHLRHDEKAAHDAHMAIHCEACHLEGIEPLRDPESGSVKWRRILKKGEPLRIHRMVSGTDEGHCRRCHFAGNKVGAAAMILPPKSILCMPCHAATFSAGDATTILALIVFLAGMVMTFAYVLTGAMETGGEESSVSKFLRLLGHGLRAIFSPDIVPIIKVLFLDVILQRRLYRQSPKRWLIHGLIFWPFLFRFCWGLVALIGSLWRPEWSGIWTMVDKNYPLTAFLFDFSGLVIFCGLLAAFFRGSAVEPAKARGLPMKDRLALGLIGAVVIIGFLLEGLRIAMTGRPAGSEYAFIGHAVGSLFSGSGDLTGLYGTIWYVHAVLTGLFIAYLPFSRLIHIIVAPIILAMNAVSERGHDHVSKGA